MFVLNGWCRFCWILNSRHCMYCMYFWKKETSLVIVTGIYVTLGEICDKIWWKTENLNLFTCLSVYQIIMLFPSQIHSIFSNLQNSRPLPNYKWLGMLCRAQALMPFRLTCQVGLVVKSWPHLPEIGASKPSIDWGIFLFVQNLNQTFDNYH